MTRNNFPAELTESELDAVTGGLKPKLDGVMITNFDVSGASEVIAQVVGKKVLRCHRGYESRYGWRNTSVTV